MKNALNTVAKGDAFENQVFDNIKELLESDMLGLSPIHSKIFKKKKYRGMSGNEIEFDISIESYHPGCDEYSTLTLIECKDYNSPISVDKLRNFAESIRDIGGHKGYFITTSSFQSGAINHARTHKIGIAKFNVQNSNIEEWILRRKENITYQKRMQMEEEIYSDSNTSPHNFVAISGYTYYSNFSDFIIEVIGTKPPKIEIKYLPDNTIKSSVDNLLNKIQHPINQPRTTGLLIQILHQELQIQLVTNKPLYPNVLGLCDFPKRTIYISPNLEYDSPRWRFTLAHEIGHFVLHHVIYDKHKIKLLSDNEINDTLSDTALSLLEVQANLFASFLLIPDDFFIRSYLTLHHQLNLRNYPKLFLDNQPCNQQSCNYIFNRLRDIFNISTEMIKIKLQKLGYLEIRSSTKQIGKVI